MYFLLFFMYILLFATAEKDFERDMTVKDFYNLQKNDIDKEAEIWDNNTVE